MIFFANLIEANKVKDLNYAIRKVPKKDDWDEQVTSEGKRSNLWSGKDLRK